MEHQFNKTHCRVLAFNKRRASFEYLPIYFCSCCGQQKIVGLLREHKLEEHLKERRHH